MIVFPGNAPSGLLSRCSIGEDRDWEKAELEGQHELSLTCGHSVAGVSDSEDVLVMRSPLADEVCIARRMNPIVKKWLWRDHTTCCTCFPMEMNCPGFSRLKIKVKQPCGSQG